MLKYAGGYTGVILRVNLSTRVVTRQNLDMALANQYIGGRGLNIKYLYDEIKPGIDPLGPENKIIIGTGPCNGTLVPGSQRFTLTTKSPLNNFVGDSNSGGNFGAEMKYAGYDMIIIEGYSKEPVYLWINDDEVELRNAADLWGKTNSETRRAIEKDINEPDVSVISIGQAGENLVRFACVMDCGRASGRGGTGAVFGSKKLKAVAIKGTKGVRVADMNRLKELVKQDQEDWRGDPAFYEKWATWGPAWGYIHYVKDGMLPTRNFRSTVFKDNFLEDIKDYIAKRKACISCPLGCGHSFLVRNGAFAGTFGESLNCEQLGDFGARFGNSDLGLLVKGVTLVNEYGVDQMNIAGVIGFAMECYEKGILTDKETGGIRLEWGKPEAIIKLIEMTVFRQGIGNAFALGIHKAAEIIGKGSEKFAIHSKGQALVMREPRASKGWALAYAVGSRGACHQRGAPPEGYPEAMDPILEETLKGYKDPTNKLLEEGKAELVKYYEELRAFQNSMEICTFTPYCGSARGQVPKIDKYLEFFNAVTGNDLTAREALKIGERIVNLDRAFNLREGLTPGDDSLPERMLKEPLPDGAAKGQVVNLKYMLDRWYELRDWDKVSGIPSRTKFTELGLGDVADELETIFSHRP